MVTQLARDGDDLVFGFGSRRFGRTRSEVFCRDLMQTRQAYAEAWTIDQRINWLAKRWNRPLPC